MSRSTALRASIAALAVLPAFTACSMLPSGQKVEATPNQAPASQDSNNNNDSNKNDSNNNNSSDNESTDSNDNGNDQDSNNNSSSNSSEDSNNNNSGDDDQDSNNNSSPDSSNDSNSNGSDSDDDSNNNSSSNSGNDSDSNSNSSSNSNDSSGSSSEGQKISTPAGSGISNLELVKLQGASTAGGKFGKVVAVFKATTDKPLQTRLRIRLFDDSGKEITQNTGLTSIYTTGDHDLVTSNLISVPAGSQPKTFKAQLVDTNSVGNGLEISEVSKPQVESSSSTPVVKGTVTTNGQSLSSSVTAQAACVTPSGKVYHGTDSLNGNGGNGDQIDYEINMHDARGVDLSDATCYVSA
ncbi:hypothetical protein [Luteococcus japonicus]|uniref:Ser-Asp rich fibrinogen-binding, bone sialoprotein-binding protein n=1 Tax=Luteococcus japonicus LSP_Lj1 TaxID=1255658 RepID=A0A1R4IZF8_9ACTN|nr:hypothetical protein [Luteococcus japonicus]SJN24925.1 Ser-Asp rich fibrinogen-binding, bone sialoprotein-binding protein [Luteococcus japonicus LSP_Lj1]